MKNNINSMNDAGKTYVIQSKYASEKISTEINKSGLSWFGCDYVLDIEHNS